MNREDEGVALETRGGLPDALRVLLRDYPRDAWEADPNFSQLIRFWLERHLMFRRLADAMLHETEATLDRRMDPARFAAHLSRYGALFVGDLHGHHAIEDHHYFPVLKTLDPRIGGGFDILDRDHQAIDGHLAAFADAANAVLRNPDEKAASDGRVDTFRNGLMDMRRFLDRHLVDEEELVVPVLLKHAPEGLV